MSPIPLLIATSRKRAGATYVAKRLSRATGASLVPTDQSALWFAHEILRRDADLYHIQFEYRTFGGVARSLVVLPLLTALLRPRGPVVVTLHGLVTEASLQERKAKRLVHLAFRLSMKATGTFASAFVVHSEAMRRTAEIEYGLERVVVIPLGSDPVPTSSGRRPASSHVVFFGFVRPEKGVQPLIEAIRIVRDEIPDIRLTIAGSVVRANEAGYLQRLRERVRAEGLEGNVRFLTKFLSAEEVSELMREATVFALPYTDQFVEVSAIVHEVAGYGVPLVCSNAPRFSELVDNVDCLKVEPEPKELARAILRILRDPALSKTLGESLIRRSQKESWDAVAERHLALYRKILAMQPAVPSIVAD